MTYKWVCVPVPPEDGEVQRAATTDGVVGGATAPGYSGREGAAAPPLVRAVGVAPQTDPMVCSVSGMSQAEISREQDRDEGLREIKAWKASKTRPLAKNLKTECARRLLRDWGSLVLRGEEDAVLYKRVQPHRAAPVCLQLVLPQHLRKEVLDTLHAGFGGGHQGAARLESMARERFHWPGLQEDVKDYCRECTVKSEASG